MGDVVTLPGLTTLPIPTERVLDGMKEMKLDEVVVLGFDKEGKLVAATSHTDKARVLYLVSRFTHKLMAGDYDNES